MFFFSFLMKQEGRNSSFIIEEYRQTGFAFICVICCMFSARQHKKEKEKMAGTFPPCCKEIRLQGKGQQRPLCVDTRDNKAVPLQIPTKNILVLRTQLVTSVYLSSRKVLSSRAEELIFSKALKYC